MICGPTFDFCDAPGQECVAAQNASGLYPWCDGVKIAFDCSFIVSKQVKNPHTLREWFSPLPYILQIRHVPHGVNFARFYA